MTEINSTKVIVIVGPTASGKSDLGIKIAKKFNGEIISADSRQVYCGMDIGTGKVFKDKVKKLRITNYELKTNAQSVIRNSLTQQYYSGGIRHHLLDIVSPKKQFTADEFKKLGEKAIKEILAKGKVPIIVGGTGFYIDILLGRMSVAEVPPSKKLRARFEKLTVEHLFKMLKKLDPKRAKTIDPKNKRRLVRALEIVITTGKPVPFFAKASQGKPKYSILWLGLRPNNLEKRIKIRLDKRLKQGMVKEIEQLRKQEVSWKRLDDFGLEYCYVSRWLIKKLRITNYELKTNAQSVIRNTQFKNSDEYQKLLREIVRYSKRQMTWFKRNKEICWVNPSANGQKEAIRLTSKSLAL